MKELGYGRVDGSVWYGLLAPAATSKSVIAKLNAESRRVLAMSDVKEKLTRAGIGAAGGTPEELGNSYAPSSTSGDSSSRPRA
jgi:tripartite-type tricarboxylate transporter receptor subunit TctC